MREEFGLVLRIEQATNQQVPVGRHSSELDSGRWLSFEFAQRHLHAYFKASAIHLSDTAGSGSHSRRSPSVGTKMTSRPVAFCAKLATVTLGAKIFREQYSIVFSSRDMILDWARQQVARVK